MTSLLSAISGQFSKSLLLSTVLPVVVFVLLALTLVLPWVPDSVALLQWVEGLGSEWKLALVTLTIVLQSALLYNLNGPIIRLYEGYPWCDSCLGQWRSGVHRKRLDSMNAQWRGLRILVRQEETKKLSGYDDVLDYWNRLGRELNTVYPGEAQSVLPTRLGNVIRSFETYPWRQYKIRGIAMWPRLLAKIDERYAAQIDEAKSSLDFMLNSSLLCGALAFLIACVHLIYPAGLASAEVLGRTVAEVLLLLGLSYGFYLIAISRASSWGVVVKGAFDLYRWALLEALGYRQRPKTLDEERMLWDWISTRFILSDLTHIPHPGYEEASRPMESPTSVQAEPGDVVLELARGARRLLAEVGLTITIQVRNADPIRTAKGVTVTEILPANWLYEWDSAQSSTGDVHVMGFNPHRFRLGDIAANSEALLTYRLLPKRLSTSRRRTESYV